MSALRALIVPATTIPKIMEEYTHPRHKEFTEDGFSVWRLYNSFTEHMKNSIWNLPKRSIALHTILDCLCKPVIEGECV